MTRLFGLLISIILVCLPFEASNSDAREVVSVFVSIPPQTYFVKQIGGNRVKVRVMVEPGANPAHYEPSPDQMKALTRTRVYFAVGVPFERAWIDRFASANPDMHIVHSDAGIEKRSMMSETHVHKGRRKTAFNDPHIWLSPALVKIQSRHIFLGLAQADPSGRQFYQRNYNRWLHALTAIDEELKTLFQDIGPKNEFMVFHPSWGYFADDYGLKQVTVEKEGKAPRASDMKRLIQTASSRGLNVVFVQPQFSAKSARMIADAIGGRIEYLDPLASDWEINLRQSAQKIRQSLTGPPVTQETR